MGILNARPTESSHKAKSQYKDPPNAGGIKGQPVNVGPKARRRLSPAIIALVAFLAIVVVAGAIWLGTRGTTGPSGSPADGGMEQGTRKGPANARVQVLMFSDFQ